MKFDVFGKKTLEVIRRNDSWLVFYCGNEGKKRFADDIRIPADLPESAIVAFVADLFHEYATPDNSEVVVL